MDEAAKTTAQDTADTGAGPSATRRTTYAFDAFLSYRSLDQAIARALCTKLSANGLRVWFDKEQIGVGHVIGPRIEQGLAESRHLVALISRAALPAPWPTMERQAAAFRDPDGRGRVILPVLLGEITLAELPESLQRISHLRLGGENDLDRIAEKLAAAIRETEAKPPKPPDPPKPVRPPARMMLLVITLLALAGGAGFAAYMGWKPSPAPPPPAPSASAMVSPAPPPAPAPVPSASARVSPAPPPTPTPSDSSTKNAVAPGKQAPIHTGTASCQGTQCTLLAGAARPIEGLQTGNRVCISAGRGDEQVQRACSISANNSAGTLCTLDAPFPPKFSTRSWSRSTCP